MSNSRAEYFDHIIEAVTKPKNEEFSSNGYAKFRVGLNVCTVEVTVDGDEQTVAFIEHKRDIQLTDDQQAYFEARHGPIKRVVPSYRGTSGGLRDQMWDVHYTNGRSELFRARDANLERLTDEQMDHDWFDHRLEYAGIRL